MSHHPIEPPPAVVVDEGREGARLGLAALVARVVDKAPPLTPQQLAHIATLLRRPVDTCGEHR